jgi:hypothetical protein
VGQATGTQRQRRGGQSRDRAAERLADAHANAYAYAEADAAPSHTESVGDGVPAPYRHAASDRDAAADGHADVRVPDGHPDTHPVGEHAGKRIGGRLTGRPVSQLVSAAGFDAEAIEGGGLQNMADRIGAVGGDVRVSSAEGTGTQVNGWVPIARATPEGSPGATPVVTSGF